MGAVSYYLDTWAESNIGQVRKVNQDACLIGDLTQFQSSNQNLSHGIGPLGSLLAVADGVGSGSKGEVASQITLEEIFRFLGHAPAPAQTSDFQSTLHEAVLRAHLRVQRYARDHQAAMMGTTLTAVGILGDHLLTAQIGDSRAYLMRGGDLVQITQDQSLVSKLIQTGHITPEEARTHPRRNIVLQAIGQPQELEVIFTQHRLRHGDTVLLSSDGLHGLVDHTILETILNSQHDLRTIAKQLIDLANQEGGSDKITVLVAKFNVV